MTRGQALTQLVRMRDMKEKRLAAWTGGDTHFLRADIGALNYAISMIEADRLKAPLGAVRETR